MRARLVALDWGRCVGSYEKLGVFGLDGVNYVEDELVETAVVREGKWSSTVDGYDKVIAVVERVDYFAYSKRKG